MFGLVSSVGRYLADDKDPQPALDLYERLMKEMKKSDDKELVARIPNVKGVTRRVKLPGNFMDVFGTTADGETFDWDKYRGKIVLVDFWATWCGPCRAEIPNMKAQLEKYGDKGFAIVGVNLDKDMKAYQNYIDQHQLTWENLISPKEEERGWDNPMAVHYGVSGIPTAILLDREGKVISMQARGPNLNRLLDEHLSSTKD